MIRILVVELSIISQVYSTIGSLAQLLSNDVTLSYFWGSFGSIKSIKTVILEREGIV